MFEWWTVLSRLNFLIFESLILTENETDDAAAWKGKKTKNILLFRRQQQCYLLEDEPIYS